MKTNRHGEPASPIRSSWAAIERMAPPRKNTGNVKTKTEWRR